MASPQLIKPTDTRPGDKRPLASGRISCGKPVIKLPEIKYGNKR